MLKLTQKEGKKGITLDLKVSPAAKENSFAGVQGDRLKVKIAAKAQEGAANAALLKFIAASFAVPVSCVQILSGKSGRLKTVFVTSASSREPDQDAAQKHLLAIAQKIANAVPGS
jgi:uncharacterized protein (TIGR00251 family)